MLPGNTPTLFRSAAAAGGGNDSFTKLLLHFEGANGSTSFVDSSPSNRGSATATNATISTAQSKFGGSSGFFNGSNALISFPDSADWATGSGPFTVDFWFNRQGGDGTNRILCGQIGSSGAYVDTSIVIMLNNANKIASDIAVGGAGNPITGTTNITAAGWHHVAFVRTGNTLKLFIDGVQEGGDKAFSSTPNDPAATLTLGRYGDYNAYYFNGYIDEFRFSKGIARWTANFTPPTAPYS